MTENLEKDVESYQILIVEESPWIERGNAEQAPTGPPGPSQIDTSLKAFIDAADSVVLNPAAHLIDPAVAAAMKHLKVEAVALSNGATSGHTPEEIESTFLALSQAGIGWFGAGRTREQARTPHSIRLPESIGGGQIHLHGYLHHASESKSGGKRFAGEDSTGYAELTVSSVAQARNGSTPVDTFHVALPYWGPPHQWRSQVQFKLAHRFLNKEYDLVLGTGAHTTQEIHRKQHRWIVYGTGSATSGFASRTPEPDYEQGGLPYSLWSILEVYREEGRRRVRLKLYPVSNGSTHPTGAHGPVSPAIFDEILQSLTSRPARPWRFNNAWQSPCADDLGLHIALDLGEWTEGTRPSRPLGADGSNEPGDWPLRSPDAKVEDKILGMNKHLGAAMLALGSETASGTTQWLTREAGIVDAGNKSMFVYRYRNHESSLGAAIVLDKVLTAEILKNSGVPTPKTVLVTSAQEAVHVASTIPGPVVIKPRHGVQSKGVTIGLVNEKEIREAYKFARDNGSQVLVQQHIESTKELRVMASPERAVAVNGRALPHVVGDGVSTIQQLIDDKNLQRTLNPSLESRPVPVDALTHRQLARSGFTVDSVPGHGERVTVRNVAGLSVGGDTIQVLEETDPRIKGAGPAAIAAIPGLGWGGVDVIIEEGTGDPYVIEINTQAAYGAALFPAYGKPLDVGNDAWTIRLAATSAVSEAEPETPEHVSSPYPLGRLSPGSHPESSIRFRTLFAESLKRQKYAITRKNLRVLNVTSKQGHTVWVTRGGLTAADRSVVQRIFQRHQWVVQTLKLRDVPHVRSRLITSVDQLRRFVERSSQVLLRPVTASWAGPNAHILPAADALALPSLPGRVWVQDRPNGLRVRVLATQDRAWVITAPTTQRRLQDTAISAASTMAVQAVRAIPELRWAGVDLFLRPRRLHDGRAGGVLVEGLTIGPEYSSSHHVIAGDFDAFCRWIIEADGARTDVAPHN